MKYNRPEKKKNIQHAKRLRKKTTIAETNLKSIVKQIKHKRVLSRWLIGKIIPPICLPNRNLILFIITDKYQDDKIRNKTNLWLNNRDFNLLWISKEEIKNDPNTILQSINNYPESEENKRQFFRSRRLCIKESYWIDNNKL